ncbi:hypothetical protein SAY87_015671 [Trapa incisa]|uniref:Uncharacterized protein n=1 Tax=Trapa incisa TaxID=236973 RepID=A0AAN7L717_9MYRT|nr:hypothetical protein SAY87_015671 [Trapa incisa]
MKEGEFVSMSNRNATPIISHSVSTTTCDPSYWVRWRLVAMAENKWAVTSDLDSEIRELREYYCSGKTKEMPWRRSQLKGLLSLLHDREDDLLEAPVEAYRDEAKLPMAALLTSAEIIPEPLGLVLIISSWNLRLRPLVKITSVLF